jgi:DNA-directed RNA polymerase subunit alpha
MISLSQPTTIIENKGNNGVFEIAALYPGYGVTIGNTLRRVLLSSLEGAAITQVKIKGVEHEFSTIDGVMEDVVTILLNLKQVRLKSHSEDPQKATLKVKGEKKVTAADFDLPSQVEVVSKDAFIAQITNKSTELEIEIQVEKGIGYVPAEARKKEKQEIGTIMLDAIYTPVKRVSTKIDDMRVGDRTDFNRLRVEVETDGTISPEEAFYQAAEILIKEFEVIISGVEKKTQAKPDTEDKEKPKKKKETKKAVKKAAKK